MSGGDIDARFAEAVLRARELMHVEAQDVRWYPKTWVTHVPMLASELADLAEVCGEDKAKPNALRIPRRRVFAVFADPTTSVTERFLAAMVWGYGSGGRGPARVTKIVENAHGELVPRLERMMASARHDDVGTAWDVALTEAKLTPIVHGNC